MHSQQPLHMKGSSLLSLGAWGSKDEVITEDFLGRDFFRSSTLQHVSKRNKGPTLHRMVRGPFSRLLLGTITLIIYVPSWALGVTQMKIA